MLNDAISKDYIMSTIVPPFYLHINDYSRHHQSDEELNWLAVFVATSGRIIKFYLHQACTQGGSRRFDRTPYFCSLKLILSLNVKYCMTMCAIICWNLHSGIFLMLKYHNFVSVWGLHPHTCILDCLLGKTRTPLLKCLRTGLYTKSKSDQ